MEFEDDDKNYRYEGNMYNLNMGEYGKYWIKIVIRKGVNIIGNINVCCI